MTQNDYNVYYSRSTCVVISSRNVLQLSRTRGFR